MTEPSSPDLSDTELDLLADLLAGEGTEQQVQQVAADPRLAQALADLADAQARVADDLRGLPPVEPPPGFTDRLVAALSSQASHAPIDQDPLAGEATTAATDPTAAGPVAATREVVPLDQDRGGRRGTGRRPAQSPPWLLRAAAGVIVVLGAGLVTYLIGTSGSDSSDDTTTAAAGAASAPQVPSATSGNDYTDLASLQRAVPALVDQAKRGGNSQPEANRDSSDNASGAGTSAPSATAPLAAAGPPTADPLARLRQPDQLTGCLSTLGLAAGTVPLAVDYASFRGAPALVVVLPSTQPAQLDVFVLGAGCTVGRDETLFFARVNKS